MEVDVNYIFKNGDPRVESFPLMESPIKTILIVISYLVFTKLVGPYLMKNREPFEFRKIMIVYNIALVILNAWIFIRFSLYGWLTTYNWRCEPTDYSNNDIAVEALFTCYVYYLSKLIELLDTIFFVLRKKQSQITFLHTVHHAIVPITVWYLVKYIGGGYATLAALFNTFVHIWMYLYYGLSAMGPSIQKYLWWKRYLTLLQLVQFVSVMALYGQALIFPLESCKLTVPSIAFNFGQCLLFFILFVHFYITSYMKETSTATKRLSIAARMKQKNETNSAPVTTKELSVAARMKQKNETNSAPSATKGLSIAARMKLKNGTNSAPNKVTKKLA